MRVGCLLAAATSLLMAGASVAQVADNRGSKVSTEQISNGGTAAPAISQVSPKREDTKTPPIQIGKKDSAGDVIKQLPSQGGPATANAQVNREARGTAGSPQLGRGERSARGSEPLSAPSEGRQTAIVRVGGSDRCDPQAAAKTPEMCRTVIETRSAEFKAPSAPVATPEQRLLFEQERAEMRSVRGAVQRVGRNDIDANAMETQTLAAITAAPPPEAPEARSAIDPTSPTALESIIQIIGAAQAGQGPR